MEEESPFKSSVAELAGKFRGHAATSSEDKPMILSPKPFKVKMKNSSIIEKLQANLTLCPSSLLPSVPRTPELKLQTAPPSPPCTSPGHTASPLLSPYGRQSSEDEEGVSFESPPEGSPLPSFNKTRARLSFKRRPPSRLHRRSLGEEAAAAAGNGLSPWQPEAERDEGAELSERMSCDPAAPPNQSEVREEERAQTVGDKDAAESADGCEADLATRRSLDALEGDQQSMASAGIGHDVGMEETTTQDALQRKECDTA